MLLPADAPLPAGVLAVTALLPSDAGDLLAGNAVPLLTAPMITNGAPLTATLVGGSATVQVDCAPPVFAGQTVALLLNDQVVAGATAAAGTAPRESLSFTLQGIADESYLLRLRVDGQDSLPVLPGGTSFDPNARLVLS